MKSFQNGTRSKNNKLPSDLGRATVVLITISASASEIVGARFRTGVEHSVGPQKAHLVREPYKICLIWIEQ